MDRKSVTEKSRDRIENLYSQSQTTAWAGLLPPCIVKKS